MNIGTATQNGLTLGRVGATTAINSSDWTISATGAMTGISGIGNNGSYTQTGTSANTFTGTSTFSNATYSALFTGGGVGIGTTTPTAPLDIKTTGSGLVRGLRIGQQSGTNGDGSYIEFNSSSVDGFGAQIGGIREGSNGENGLVFRTGTNAQAERMRIDNAGNVGIGTTAPLSKFNLHSGTGDGSTYDTILSLSRKSSTGNVEVGKIVLDDYDTNHANMIFKVKTTASAVESDAFYTDALTIKGTNGNVGIGTTNPSLSKLEVNGGIRILSTPSDVYGSGVIFKDETSSTEWQLHSHGDRLRTFNGTTELTYATTGDLTGLALPAGTEGQTLYNNAGTWTVNSGLFYDDAYGNVGIGTTTPYYDAKLEVHNDTANSNVLRLSSGTAVGSYPEYGPSMTFNDGNTDVASIKGAAESTGLFGILTFKTLTYTDGLTEKMRIDSDGNVGIGTINPGVKLQINGGDQTGPTLGSAVGGFALTGSNNLYGMYAGVSTNGDTWLQSQRNDTNTSVYDLLLNPSGGNVGIGTTTPGRLLDVVSSDGYIRAYKDADEFVEMRSLGTFYATRGSNSLTIDPQYGGVGASGPIAFFGNANMRFSAENTSYPNQLYLKTDGKVGINTTSPGSALSISEKLLLFDTTPTNAATTTKMGYLFKNNYPAGSILEAVGTEDILSYGINVPQFGTRTTTAAGGILRMDTRSTIKKFSIIGYASGESTAAERFSVSLQDGTTIVPILAGTGTRAVYSTSTGVLTNTASDSRLKKNVMTISKELDVLSTLSKLRGVYYNWDTSVDAAKDLGEQREIGMIAQEVQAVMPELVGQNSTGYFSLDYSKMSGFLVEVAKAQQTKIESISDIADSSVEEIKQMNLNLSAITGEIVPTAGSAEETFSNNFFANLYTKVGDWLASADNGIKSIFARKISTKLLCVADEAGVETCIEKTQLDSLLARAEVSASENNDSTGGINTDVTPAVVNPNAPIITLTGDATINLNIGDTYTELGATVMDDKDDFVAVSITGVPDTSANGIYAIHYNAVDTDGNNAIELTRKIIVGTGVYTLTGVSGEWDSGNTTGGTTSPVNTDTTTVTDSSSSTTVPTGSGSGSVSAPATTEPTPTPIIIETKIADDTVSATPTTTPEAETTTVTDSSSSTTVPTGSGSGSVSAPATDTP